MVLGRWLAAHKSVIAAVTSGTTIAAVVATTAILSTGYTAQRMDLGDGSVWVVNGTDRAIGRASTEVLELNSVISAQGTDLEVVQQGDTVLLVDHGNASLDIIDPATSTEGDSVALPPQQPDVWLAGENVVIEARGTGEVWIVPRVQLEGFDPSVPATLSFGTDAVLTVTPDGVLYAYSPDQGEVYRVDLPSGARSADVRWSVDFPANANEFQITAVGDRWAVLDVTDRVLATDGASVDLSDLIAAGAGPELQLPGTAADAVLVAHDGGLISVPFGGDDPVQLVDDRNGPTTAPVVLGDCTFAAWAGDPLWRSCGGEVTELDLDSLATTATLSLTVNADRVVLNDTRSGATWAVQQNGELIDNWQELIQVDEERQQEQDEAEDIPPEVEQLQQPPVAVDDELGARPARATVLPVMLNDYDANGDVLVISDVEPIADSIGRVDLISRNQQIQLTLNEGASGVVTFRYSITDGRGGSASATVRVTVRSPLENGPPVQARTTKTTVAQGGQVTTQVLGDWIDPDGDAFYLEGAFATTDDRVSSKPDGTVLFTDSGAGGGLKTVTLAVSDGSASGTGSLAVTVRQLGAVPIIADPFVVLAHADEEITIAPLEHVRGGNAALRLNAVPPKTGVTVTPSFETGTFTFVSSQVRTHYIEYVVTDGTQTVTGLIRVDVSAPPDPNATPVTIPKTVFVRTLSGASVDVAGTDIDPAGGVLLVTEVNNVPEGSGVRTEILEQRSVRVTLLQPLDAPVTFGYRVSNGLAEAQGTITVIEIPRPAQLQPPIARDDAVTVRVGDLIDIPVLANDEQPDGEDITLDPVLVSEPTAGLLFTAADRLRYLAPKSAGNFTASYQVTGPDGQFSQATVTIQVRERSQATNNPPVPAPVVARVLAGETVRIQIPLTGIDPDGDSVQLLGQSTNPEKGSVISLGSDFIEYQAGAYSAGTDTFGYTIMDGLGARATGSIRVGISPRVEGGRNPVAVDDLLTVRPAKSVTIQVLSNDSDPDGGTLEVTTVRSNGPELKAEVVDGEFVKVTTPTEPGTYGLVYSIANRFGGTNSAFITLEVTDQAPLSRPVANDTVLAVSDVIGRETVDVAVLNNVFFADGEVTSLGLAVLPGYGDSAQVLPSKRVRVTVREDSQIIPFSVAHPEDPSVRSYAFIRVPGLDDALPQIDRSARPIKVVSEQSVTINLNDYVVALGGSRVRLTDRSSVRATHSDGKELVVDDDTLVFTSAPRYFGPASISFEVTDGDPDDPNANRATLSLPIEVQPRDNQPPVFIGGSLAFEPGQQRDIDLVRLTNYPYADDLDELTFTVSQPPVGFRYEVNGQRLVITAEEGASKGSATAIVIGVADAINTGQAGRIQLQVVPSTRPLARPAPDSAIAKRGETTTIDVLTNDTATNPFPTEPLHVLQVRGLDGSSIPDGVRVTASADNSRIQAVVASDAAPGDINLQYQVADATNDPDRYVWGSVRISVQDRPDPVTGVRVVEFGDRMLRLSWTPGQFNNSPITKYTVTVTAASDGRVLSTVNCTGPGACSITTPGNGPDNSVRLAVVATNGIGNSDPASNPGPIWSDIIPPPPDALSSTPLNQGLRVSWKKPSSSGAASPISYYVIRVGVASVTYSVSTDDPVGTPYSVNVNAGAINGSATVYGVSARNSAPNSLATWNEATGTGTPAGPPIRVNSASGSSTDSSTASLGWAGVFDANGRAISQYWAVAYDGAAPSCTVSGVGSGSPSVSPPSGAHVVAVAGNADPRATFTGLSVNTTYNLVVFAYNGQGCESSLPIVVIPREAPGTVNGVTIGPLHDNGNGTWDYSLAGWTTGPGSGDATQFQYQLVADGVDGSISSLQNPGAGLVTGNGSQYGKAIKVQVKVCASYPELAAPLCSANWSAAFDVGVPVNANLVQLSAQPSADDGTLFPKGVWSWTDTPSGPGYTSMEISCDGGANFVPLAPGAGSCQSVSTIPLLPAFPSLIVRIGANGDTYPKEYPWP